MAQFRGLKARLRQPPPLVINGTYRHSENAIKNSSVEAK